MAEDRPLRPQPRSARAYVSTQPGPTEAHPRLHDARTARENLQWLATALWSLRFPIGVAFVLVLASAILFGIAFTAPWLQAQNTNKYTFWLSGRVTICASCPHLARQRRRRHTQPGLRHQRTTYPLSPAC